MNKRETWHTPIAKPTDTMIDRRRLQDKTTGYFKYLVLLVLVGYPLFAFLDTLPIRIWDESRLAINAYEMYKSGNYLVTTFHHQPDLWNTKPPLMIVLQALFMKVIGVNELAVRLPSAIAAFITALAIFIFSLRYLKSFWYGFIAVLVLITSEGYIGMHAARTGDYDVLLTLFSTVSSLFFFLYTETRKSKYLYLYFILLSMAVLTKSVAGLLFLPAMLMYVLIRGLLLTILKEKHFYLGMLSFVLMVGGYYFFREMASGGYLQAVYNNELGGRYLDEIENHTQEFLYYYKNIIHYRLAKIWFVLVPAGMGLGWACRDSKFRHLSIFSSLIVITFFLIISSAKTKLEWYDIPMYPFFALLIANVIYFVFRLLKQSEYMKAPLRYNIAGYLFLYLVFILPYQSLVHKVYKPYERPQDETFYQVSHLLQDGIKANDEHLNRMVLVYKGYKPQLEFYANIMYDRGITFKFSDNFDYLNKGDLVIVTHKHSEKELAGKYDYKVFKRIKSITIYEIL